MLHSALLDIELTNGNDGRGSKWFSSAKRRKEYAQKLIAWGHRRTPFEVPVRICVTRILGKGQRLWDVSSIGRGNFKEIEDAIVEIGWLHDDGPAWVTSVEFKQHSSSRHIGPKTLIEVFAANEGNSNAN